jgi:acyl-CoA thioester hydrolase
MTHAPIVYTTTHRVKFSDLDPYNHMNTARYAAYFVDHRMEGLRANAGWDLKTLAGLSFMTWVRRLEIEFIRPARGDQEVVITSFVREFQGPDALIECEMSDVNGTVLSKCRMAVAHVDKSTSKASNWPVDIQAVFFE